MLTLTPLLPSLTASLLLLLLCLILISYLAELRVSFVGTTGEPEMEALDECRSMSEQPHDDQCSEDFLVVAAAVKNTRIRRDGPPIFQLLILRTAAGTVSVCC